MNEKHLKRTDQEWFELIQDCRTSGLKIKVWCEQHSVTIKALYYHTRRLRQKGYAIPQRTVAATPLEKQEGVCLGIPNDTPSLMAAPSHSVMGTAGTAAIRIDFYGVLIEVSNHAAQDTITNTFHALRGLC